MLPRNTMQYGTDGFEFRRQALLKSRQPLDFTYETSISNFQISGTEPENCSRRVIFSIDDKLYRFVNGNLDQYDDREDLTDILRYGNTVAELLALNADSLASLVGKRVYPIIALDAPADSPVMPSIKISAKVNSFNDVYTVTRYSPVYELKRNGDACKIVDISASKTLNGYGTATVKCKLKNPVTGWGDDWISLEAAQYQLATAVQFQATYLVTTLDGSDFAQVVNVVTRYTTDADQLSGDTAEIVTVPLEYPYGDLGTCYALIKTSELFDCDLRAFVTFSAPTAQRENIPLGNATGALQILPLMYNGVLDKNIQADTLRLTAGGKTFSGFYFDTKESTVTFTAKAGEEMAASYECGTSGDELWREMELDFSHADEGIYSHRFIYRLSATDSKNKRASAVKFRFTKKTTRVENQLIGVGNGREQIFHLPHKAKAESINCTGAWKYDEGAQTLRVKAAIDVDILCSYEWIGEVPEVKEIIVGWSAAV